MMPNNPVPAAATGLPDDTRRGFLRGLAALPLIGGGVALLGRPTAVAEPVTTDMLMAYKNWLQMEHRILSFEMVGYDTEQADWMERSFWPNHPGGHWHTPSMKDGDTLPPWRTMPQPSTRAALVLSAVGCDWREARHA